MLTLQNLAYTHPNKEVVFSNLNLTVNKQSKIALVGNNGTGKSTLLKLMAGVLHPSKGRVSADARPYYIPQLFGQLNACTIAQALNIEHKLHALKEILGGEATETNLALLEDDWSIEERCHAALAHWRLAGLDLWQKMESLSGGQKTSVFLAGISIHQPGIILMDEPSNHLDTRSRQLLYNFIQNTPSTLVVVSHDRKLLNLLSPVYELSKGAITSYGGSYAFYAEQKRMEAQALSHGLKSKEKALRKAKEVERETLERQQKRDARGKKKQEKAGLPTIVMKTFKDNAEKSTARAKDIHAEKTTALFQELNDLRNELPDRDKMKLGFNSSALHKGKVLVTAKQVNFGYGWQLLWKKPLDLVIASGDRIAVKGLNGSGKTTLIKIILGELKPSSGSVQKADNKAVYIDQDYSLINNRLSVYEQAQQFNVTALHEHEIKTCLNRFLFTKNFWDKPCSMLSGGEKMRLVLCCLTIGTKAPDLMILDEPTNNLDLQNAELLAAAINGYQGTLIVISHDDAFLEQIKVQQAIELG